MDDNQRSVIATSSAGMKYYVSQNNMCQTSNAASQEQYIPIHNKTLYSSDGHFSTTTTGHIDPSQVLSVALNSAQITQGSNYLQPVNSNMQQIPLTVQSNHEVLHGNQVINAGNIIQNVDSHLLQSSVYPTHIGSSQIIQASGSVDTNTQFYQTDTGVAFGQTIPTVVTNTLPVNHSSSSDLINLQPAVPFNPNTMQYISSSQVTTDIANTSQVGVSFNNQQGIYSHPEVLQSFQYSEHPGNGQEISHNKEVLGQRRLVISVGKYPPPQPAESSVGYDAHGKFVIITGKLNHNGRWPRLSNEHFNILRNVMTERVKKDEKPISAPMIPLTVDVDDKSNIIQLQQTANKSKPQTTNKYYGCTNCGCTFMRPVMLRNHMKSCRPPEQKLVEKLPLLMCSYCKSTFNTHPQINHHFTICSHCPLNIKTDIQPPSKRPKLSMDNIIAQGVQYRCTDCDRTFNKQRQFTSHIKKCTQTLLQDLTHHSARSSEPQMAPMPLQDELQPTEDPFADPPVATPSKTPVASRRGGYNRGRRGGRRAGRGVARGLHTSRPLTPQPTNVASPQAVIVDDKLISDPRPGAEESLIVADTCGLVRSNTGLSHALQLSLENNETHGVHKAVVTNSKGIVSRSSVPDAWSLVCGLCEKLFLTKGALAVHMMSSHGPDLKHSKDTLTATVVTSPSFRCPVCNLHYASGDSLLEHLVLQHAQHIQSVHAQVTASQKPVVCCVCSLVLATRGLLLEHLSLAHLDELTRLAGSHANTSYSNISHKLDQLNASYDATVIKSEKGFSRQDSMSPLNSILCSPSSRQSPVTCKPSLTSSSPFLSGTGAPLTPSTYSGTPDHASPESCEMSSDKDETMSRNYYMRPSISENNVVTMNRSGELECTICTEVLPSSKALVEHYAQQHNIERDSDGCLMDIGKDIDIKIKETSTLVTPSKGNGTLPQKTVLLRPISNKEIKCKECHKSVKDKSLREHLRHDCGGGVHEPYCCTNLACEKNPQNSIFSQINDLFDHESTHHPERCIDMEKKIFPSLPAFKEWLSAEQSRLVLSYEEHSSPVNLSGRIYTSLVQYRVCQYYSKPFQEPSEMCNQSKTSNLSDNYIRIKHPNHCFSRIQLKIHFNKKTNCHDGETTMFYYPTHSHPTGIKHEHLEGAKSLPFRGLNPQLLPSGLTVGNSPSTYSRSKRANTSKSHSSNAQIHSSDPHLNTFSSQSKSQMSGVNVTSLINSSIPVSNAKCDSNVENVEAITKRAGPFISAGRFYAGQKSSNKLNNQAAINKVGQTVEKVVTYSDGNSYVVRSSDDHNMLINNNQQEMLLNNGQNSYSDDQTMVVTNGSQRVVMIDGQQGLILNSKDGETYMQSNMGNENSVYGGQKGVVSNMQQQRFSNEQTVVMTTNSNGSMSSDDQKLVFSDGKVLRLPPGAQRVVVDESGRMMLSDNGDTFLVEQEEFMMEPEENMMESENSMMEPEENMLMEVEQGSGEGDSQDYVLPADEGEWLKLFDHLIERLRGVPSQSGQPGFTPQERIEAQNLVQHRNNVTKVDVEQQIHIFRRVCKLTNANI